MSPSIMTLTLKKSNVAALWIKCVCLILPESRHTIDACHLDIHILSKSSLSGGLQFEIKLKTIEIAPEYLLLGLLYNF